MSCGPTVTKFLADDTGRSIRDLNLGGAVDYLREIIRR